VGRYILSLERICILLNAFYRGGSASFDVYSPLLSHRLFSVELGRDLPSAKVSNILSPDRYEDAYAKATGFNPSLKQEIPTFDYYCFVLLASSVIQPTGWNTSKETLISNLGRNPLKGQKQVFVSFDTNALINRCYHLVSKTIKKEDASLKCGYVLSSGVIDELSNFDRKYSKEDLAALGKTITDRDALEGFTNQLKLESRKFRIGFVETKVMSTKEYFEKADGESGDNHIISSLDTFQRNKNVDILVFSEDSDFIDRAAAKRLGTIPINRPAKLPESAEIDWADLGQLLYVSAAIYGNLRIQGPVKARLSGIWAGKKGEDWNTESVLVSTENSEAVKFIDLSLAILDKMKPKKD